MTPVHTGFCTSIAANAELKAVTTPPPTGATIGPVIVHGGALVIPPAKVVPTCPLMPIPGPVSEQVTVPMTGTALAPRTAKGAAAPRSGETGTCANAGEAP